METNKIDLTELRIDRAQYQFGPRKRFKRWRGAIGALAAIALMLSGFVFFKDSLRPGAEVQLVTASMASPAQASAVLTASGYVVARRKAAVASKGTGTLVYLGVEEGDRVKKGQVIARLENADVTAALERARQNLRVAEADLNDAQASMGRSALLLKKDFIARSEYDAAEARYRRVIASIEAAKFAVKEAEVAVANTRIIAPFDGTVLKKNADVGEIVAPLAGAASSRAAVVTIADMSSLEVEADVSEANITRVFANQAGEIRLDAYPARSYIGYVANIVPTADRSKATVMVKIRFKEYDERVLPDMSAKITFLGKDAVHSAESNKPFLGVPDSAVAMRDGKSVVYRVHENRAVENRVVIGRRFGSVVEIQEGLNEGERVIARPDERIRAGVKVAVGNR